MGRRLTDRQRKAMFARLAEEGAGRRRNNLKAAGSGAVSGLLIALLLRKRLSRARKLGQAFRRTASKRGFEFLDKSNEGFGKSFDFPVPGKESARLSAGAIRDAIKGGTLIEFAGGKKGKAIGKIPRLKRQLKLLVKGNRRKKGRKI